MRPRTVSEGPPIMVLSSGSGINSEILSSCVARGIKVLLRQLLGIDVDFVTHIFTSWNPLTSWLRQVERLRRAA